MIRKTSKQVRKNELFQLKRFPFYAQQLANIPSVKLTQLVLWVL